MRGHKSFKPTKEPNMTMIEVKFVRTNFFTRWPCTICGGCTEKVNVLTEGQQPLSDDGEYRQIRICERCLEKADIDGSLELHARQLEAEAELLREMIGRLKAPTYEEWQAREEREDVAAYRPDQV